MRTLIKGGTIVTAEQEFVGDILVEGEIIRAMGAHLDEKGGSCDRCPGKICVSGRRRPAHPLFRPVQRGRSGHRRL